MRILLLAGASALALATPALAQSADSQPNDQTEQSELDSRAPADEPAAKAPPARTGDPVLDRLNALEARIGQLEAENAELRQQSELDEGRIETVETRASKGAQF